MIAYSYCVYVRLHRNLCPHEFLQQPTAAPTSRTASRRSSPVGGIVGAVIGVFVAAVIAYIIRRNRHSCSRSMLDKQDTAIDKQAVVANDSINNDTNNSNSGAFS
jgi:hypothetical protein